ncbi:MAG: hypothetical protein R3F14_13990 [Polyangiaceae bacterium]
MRDPETDTRASQGQAGFLLTDTGITLRSSTQKIDAAEKGGKVDVRNSQVIITQGNKKYGIAVSASGIVFQASDQKKVLDITGNAVQLAATAKVDFSKANKVLLG